MGSPSPLNVFKGPNALDQYFDPDQNPPLPLVEIPDALNPLRQDGVRIFAKMLTALPAQNVKSLPALKMLLNEPGADKKSIVEASSGSTVLSLGIIARALWGHDDVTAYVTNKKHVDSLRLLRFFGLKVALYGGLAQQEPSDPKGIMNRLRKLVAQDSSVCYLGQYDNDHNWGSHYQWTGAQIFKQLPEINVFCATVGTGGCVSGTGVYLKSKKPSVKIIGVCNVFGDPTPGPRHFPGFESSQFPWRETIDHFETVASAQSFRSSMQLCRHGIIAGPSSGESLHGLLTYLQALKTEGCLSDLANPATGEISCVFVCADLPYPYMDTYFKKLGEDEFPAIYNQNLLACDLDPYDERWFLTPTQVAALLSYGNGDHLSAPFDQEPLPDTCKTVLSPETGTELSSSASTTNSYHNALSSGPSTAPSSPTLPPQVSTKHNTLTSDITVVDIRPTDAFACSHLPGSRNIPLPETEEDFYGKAEAVQRRWNELKQAFDGETWLWKVSIHEGQKYSGQDGMSDPPGPGPVLVVCTDGDSGRMAAAMLRAKGREAFCVEGGYGALAQHLAAK
ncbi:hypothetical protein LOZ61_005334 [Ophidiomyces ophidiicola]|nr:hypothetical protein LOZ61_005334 [Ophidiomyces ophidiicola]KAI1923909.1 hypothetical protein LOZ60_004980 [Ophidiomyces ophidiicola]KAI2141557.1 hypothetical protein LOZ27_004499 [Ophidiomyces ophidiicola]KAI2158539.1 hypothetical protein LOZ25_003365 [Ophidiomyces ophidiicola]KAI2414296.1 hypothetical protein LOY90_001490 [Ophidiomyces ophidiicola]